MRPHHSVLIFYWSLPCFCRVFATAPENLQKLQAIVPRPENYWTFPYGAVSDNIANKNPRTCAFIFSMHTDRFAVAKITRFISHVHVSFFCRKSTQDQIPVVVGSPSIVEEFEKFASKDDWLNQDIRFIQMSYFGILLVRIKRITVTYVCP